MSKLHLKVHGSIAELRLDNPAKLNALTVPMLEALEGHCRTIERNPEIRAKKHRVTELQMDVQSTL